MSTKLVAYLRISCAKSGGADSLGIDAQRTAVERYASARGLTVGAEFVEVESARRDSLKNRPQLRAALAHAKRERATLVIARLDRLARSVFVTAELMQSNVDFVAVDNPNANRMTIQIMAVMAEHESRCISERTKAAMAAAKARGRVFGRPNLTPADQRKATVAAAVIHRMTADAAYEDIAPRMRELRAAGLTLQGIADHMNARGSVTRRNCAWNGTQVQRVLQRF